MLQPTPQISAGIPIFRYYHLLGWLLAAAVAFFEHHYYTTASTTSRLFGQLVVHETAGQFATRLLATLAIGGQLAIVAFGVCWLRRGLRFPSQPGHWLAIMQLATVIVLAVCNWWTLKIERAENALLNDSDFSQVRMLEFCWCAGMAMLAAWLAWQRKEDKHWRLLYLGVACLMVVMTLPDVLFYSPLTYDLFVRILRLNGLLILSRYASETLAFGLFTGVATCLVLDLFKRISRDWVHWAGVAFSLTTSVLRVGDIMTTAQVAAS